MQNIFIGNTRINGNLEVEGTQTILNTETLIIQDGIIGVNSPAVVGRDSGLLIERAPDFTGTATIINNTSAIIEQIAEPGWFLKIGSETREILIVSGTTVTYANWTPSGTVYQLFKNLSAGFFYKPSTEKFYAGYTQNTSSDNILSITPGTFVVNRLEQLFGEQVWYVGKHGHDSLSGRTVSEARLTFTSIPDGSTIICFDDGVYNETVPVSGVIFAPNAQINYLQITGGQINIKSFINASINGGILKFISGSTITASGQNKIYGERLTGITGLNCTSGEINGHITEFDCLISVICDGTVNLTSESSLSPTLATGSGTLYFLCSKINSFVTSGSGSFYAVDAQMASNHFSNNNNPHNVTFAQISTMTQKGDLLTHNGTNNIVLPRGTAGQVLTVKNDLNLGWETAAFSSSKTFMIHPEMTLVSSNSFVTIAYFTWKHSEFSSYGPGKLIFNIVSTINMKFTNGITDFINGTFTAGYHAAAMVSNPLADTVIFLQVQKNITGGKIIGVSLLF